MGKQKTKAGKRKQPADKGLSPAVKWPADDVKRVALSKLVPYARNARTHSEAQVAQIAASMREFGWTMPVLMDEAGGIIAGHGRVLAAKLNGYPDAPCMTAVGWSEAKKRAYVLADNKLSLNAGWDEEMLAAELQDLLDMDFDMSLTGFAADEIDELLKLDDEDALGEGGAGSLSDRFGIAPFSVLNAREGWWQDRKRTWLALGIQSEVGRGENLLKFSDSVKLGGTIEQKGKAKKARARAKREAGAAHA